jgi:release factor glutamine methyltransferase
MMQPDKGQGFELPAGIGKAVDAVARLLAAAGVDTPREDARRLVVAAAACNAIDLIVHPGRELEQDARQRLERFVARRMAREPVSRILGSREFYGRSFEIAPATLDPRPDSETLIDAVLELTEAEGWRDQELRILDIGTGSGCLLVTLLCELPYASGLGTDISSAALDVAKRNAEHHGVADRCGFEQRRSLQGVDASFDFVMSNPPYIETAAIAGLAPEVRDFDPASALDGGADGLEVYREIAASLEAVILNGWAVFEIGAGQSESVTKILSQAISQRESPEIRLWRDLNGHTRCVAVRIQQSVSG